MDPDWVRRYQRQLLLAPIGGAGQQKLQAATVLLHGDAPLCATYLAAAGVGCLRHSGPRPELASHDPGFRLEPGAPGDEADFVLDLGDGEAWRAARGPKLWGGVVRDELRLDAEPVAGARLTPVLQTLAAGEAAWRLLGHAAHRWSAVP
ncbi:MAG: hypothetical protein AAGD14_18845 [Planctomycetota bacterium]